jgi:hypothetical protein
MAVRSFYLSTLLLRKIHKSLNNPLETCVTEVTYAYRIDPVDIKYNQDVLRTYIEHGADCLEIYVFFMFSALKCYNRCIKSLPNF